VTSEQKDDAAKARWFTPGKILATTGAIVGLTAAVVGLVFGFDPGLRPCLGNSQASIKTTIVPHVRNRDFLLRHGTSRSDAENEPNYLGAEVRYTIQADSLRGHDLPIKYSLFYVGKDGTLGAIAANEDRVSALEFRPETFSDQGGDDFLVPVPQPRRHYRILIELFRDEHTVNRIDLTESEIFSG